jgi:hypothetical protein
MLTDIVQAAISSFHGAEFIRLDRCPVCGGPVQGYDTRTKKYAVIRDGTGERTITVRVKRFTCRKCNRLCNACEPFYPGTRIGSLVVDLFYTFTATMPASRAARLIDAMGIRVDRTSWKNYTGRPVPEIPTMEIFGMRLPSSVLTLSNIAARIPDGGCVEGPEALAACGYPSTFRPEAETAAVTAQNEPAQVPASPLRHGLQADSAKQQAESGSS